MTEATKKAIEFLQQIITTLKYQNFEEAHCEVKADLVDITEPGDVWRKMRRVGGPVIFVCLDIDKERALEILKEKS